MKVTTVTRYVYKGKEYNSLEAIKEELHNTIGLEVLDKVTKNCPLQRHRDYQVLLDLLCRKDVREVLLECLNVTFDHWDEDDEVYTVNVLDS